MTKSVLKREKYLLKRSLATSIALVVAMVALSLSLATKITYAEELTSTNPEITVNGNFGGSMHTLKVKEFPVVDGDNSTYNTLKGYIEPSYEEFKTWELTVDPIRRRVQWTQGTCLVPCQLFAGISRWHGY